MWISLFNVIRHVYEVSGSPASGNGWLCWDPVSLKESVDSSQPENSGYEFEADDKPSCRDRQFNVAPCFPNLQPSYCGCGAA